MLVLRDQLAGVRSVAYSPDGRSLATCAEDVTIRVWDLPSGTARVTIGTDFAGSPEVLAFCHGGKYLACGSAEGRLTFWDCATWQSRANTLAHSAGVRCLARAPDGLALASAGWGDGLLLWGIPTLQHRSLARNGAAVGLAFTPQGKELWSAGQDGTLERFDVAGGDLLSLEGVGKQITALAASPAGGLLALGHTDGAITLWDAAGERAGGEFRGHTWTVYGLAFTPDGQTLVSGGADGTVRTWDVAARRERHAYRWNKSWVTCLAVAPDGMTAAAGSDDHTVVVWDLDDA
jgi:WD40 repeat protein